MMAHEHREIEVRFLEIDKAQLIQKLNALGATDLGEEHLTETIFYDKDLTWKNGGKKIVRVRTNSKHSKVTYKHHFEDSATGTTEYEITVDNPQMAHLFLEAVGLVAFRNQEKKRHTFQLDDVTFDIDTWPKIPTYVELEGPTEESLKEMVKKLDLDWNEVTFENPRTVIENKYNIPVGEMKYFTFDRFE
jgi:adenylate cyclase class 2